MVARRPPYRGAVDRTRLQDACPGALQTHQAADGPLARIRLPGGMVTAAQLEALAVAATEFAAGTLEFTVRGNVQLRGITDTAAAAEAVAAAGLLPSPSHETAGWTADVGGVKNPRQFPPTRAVNRGKPVPSGRA